MLSLAVDTSTRAASLAVLRDEHVIGTATISSDQPYAAQLQSKIDLLLRDSNISLTELDLFSVAIGPGSFTGLRVGLTAVKAWAEVFQKPVSAVSVLQAIAAQASSLKSENPIVAVLDARRGQVFSGIYKPQGESFELIGDEVVDRPEEVVKLAEVLVEGNTPIFCSPTPEVIEAALATSQLQCAKIERVSPLLAPTVGLLGYRKALRGDTVDALQLDASYVRRTDAEMKWKGFELP